MGEQRAHRVTRKDVAREAGTSVAVVSYVINNGPRPVAETTKQRVLDAVKTLGYRPNSIARALVSGVTQTYGLVVPNISNPFISSFSHALQQEALAKGLVLLLGDAGDSRQRELEIIHKLLRRQVDGLLYYSVDRHPHLELIQSSNTPCVMLEPVAPELNISSVCVDERAAACQATQHLIGHGYQDIAIICGPLDMLNTQDRLNGWRDALQQAGLNVNEEWIYPTPYTRAGGYDVTRHLLQKPRPRALFVTNELQAFGCLRALAEQNIAVPDEMALVCFNATEASHYCVPSLTAVCQPVSRLAKTAINLLQEWDGEVRCCEFAFELKIGESCGCALKKSPQ